MTIRLGIIVMSSIYFLQDFLIIKMNSYFIFSVNITEFASKKKVKAPKINLQTNFHDIF